MFLHLGNGVSVLTRDVIAIYDYMGFFIKDVPDNQHYLQRCQKEGRVVRTNEEKDLIKSVVVTKDKVYLSVLSSTALKKRAQMVYDLDND
ncbi:extracellular matrix regulator RemB [Mitsuokella sp. WILCCON 0060]|uniref:extracellular matrix regulator RemB n=1 Tax=unclassified Mitsuokella TaxID=2637239 RepID=UPI003F095333